MVEIRLQLMRRTSGGGDDINLAKDVMTRPVGDLAAIRRESGLTPEGSDPFAVASQGRDHVDTTFTLFGMESDLAAVGRKYGLAFIGRIKRQLQWVTAADLLYPD